MKQAQGNQRQATLLSYLAGIIDGEGTIRINKCTGAKTMLSTRSKSPKYAAYIGLGMVKRQIPELLKAQFGGSVREECVPGRRSIWRWTASGGKCVPRIAKALLPYLIIKKRNAEIAIEFCENWFKINRWQDSELIAQELQRREDAYRMMRKFNACGAAATTERENIRENEATV